MTPIPRRRPLKTLRDVRREMGTLYWLMRRGQIDSTVGSRCAFVLQSLGRLIESSELEEKLEAIEHDS